MLSVFVIKMAMQCQQMGFHTIEVKVWGSKLNRFVNLERLTDVLRLQHMDGDGIVAVIIVELVLYLCGELDFVVELETAKVVIIVVEWILYK